MRWITDEDEFRKIYLENRTCVYTDSGREATDLSRLTFDDANLCTRWFAELLKRLMELSNEDAVYFTVLNPDPYIFFYDRYGVYPSFELKQNDFSDEYIKALNKPYGKEAGDNLGTIYWEFVFTPLSRSWFIHALRSSDDRGGHLWVPKEWQQPLIDEFQIFLEGF